MKLNHKTSLSSSSSAAISSSSDRNNNSSSPASNMASSLPSSPPSQEDENQTFEAKTKGAKLEKLLANCAQFSNILVQRSEVLGRVGHGIDGQAIGQHSIKLTEQPKCMVGGTMRDYQLEGLTWMYEIAVQGMSGILADEMGLGKTIQTISLLAKLRDENFIAAHMIVAPLSTLSNWQDEFAKWTPSIPVVKYHGTPKDRRHLFKTQLLKNFDKKGEVTHKFPIVLTTPDIVLRDAKDLKSIRWEMIIIDEGHRLKNSEAKLFKAIQLFTSQSRFLITGTPLQNNLKELWSLLHFLLPKVFQSWNDFESWFDFDGLKDEKGTEEFLQDKKKQELVKKMHTILQPLLLRRIKADVEHLLPKKREYVLYAPLTKEQTELYNVISDRAQDTRAYLQDKVIERITGATNTPALSPAPTPKAEESDSEDDMPLAILTKKASSEATPVKRGRVRPPKNSTPRNPFQQMMEQNLSTKEGVKRKAEGQASSRSSKSAKSSRQSTPATSVRGRKIKKKVYVDADTDAEEALSDEDFENKLVDDFYEKEWEEDEEEDEEETQKAENLEVARKEILNKKLGNPIMQLRLTCNSPLHFYNPWTLDSGLEIDETLVSASGKMLLLDRLLPALFARGSKVLIFSQFTKQLDQLEDYARILRNWPVCRIDGSVFQESRREQIKDFNENPEYRLFLLTTRAGGQGINLASADTVILFDSDYNPQSDLQAQDRAHRIGQKNPVIIYRFATKGTVEETLLHSADAKRRLEKLVIKKGGFKTMDQKLDNEEEMSEDALKSLLLKDGTVYEYRGGDQEILTDADLDVLCDRSEEAYERAEKGEGDREGFRIVETKAEGLMMGMEKLGGKK